MPFFRPETGIFLLLWLFFLGFGRSRLFQDPGTFWHTKVGEQILTTGQLIRTDSFTFTWYGQPWIAHQWLGECLMALVHRLDGLDSLLLATATIVAALYSWLAGRLIRSGLHWSLAVVVMVLVVGASASHLHVRPHLGTIVFLALTMALLTDFENGRSGLGRLFWLAPIFLVWTNIHGGTLGGLATMGLALAGWSIVRFLLPLSPEDSHPARRAGCESGWLPKTPPTLLGAVFAACCLTVIVTPYGTRIFQTWLAIWGSEILPRIIVEHKPLSFTDPDTQLVAWLVMVLGGVYLAALVSTLPRWPRVCWLLPLAWLYLAFDRVRNAPLFAVMAVVALADMLPFTRFAAWAARSGSDLFQHRAQETTAPKRFDWPPMLLPVVAVVTALVLQAARLEVPVVGHGWVRLDPSYWPVELLPDLRNLQATDPAGTRIFNEYLYGGFLIYHTPGFRLFVDDRCELYRSADEQYRDQWLDEFVRAEGEDTAAAFARWEKIYPPFDFALVTTRQPGEERGFDQYFFPRSDRAGVGDPEWLVVKHTPTATLYRRKNRR
jgi:hypothetical protein